MSKTAPATPDDSQNFAPFAPVLGQIGTLIACAGALVAQLTPPQLRGLAIAVWIAGLLFQIAAFALASTVHRAGSNNERA